MVERWGVAVSEVLYFSGVWWIVGGEKISDYGRAKESVMLGLPYESIFKEEIQIGSQTVDGTQLKWSVFRDFPADRMYSVMQEWVL